MIRYERVPLAKLLQSIELHATREQRDLTRLLHACGARLENSVNPQLVEIFAAETERTPGYGVLSQTDRSAFEQVMAELDARSQKIGNLKQMKKVDRNT